MDDLNKVDEDELNAAQEDEISPQERTYADDTGIKLPTRLEPFRTRYRKSDIEPINNK